MEVILPPVPNLRPRYWVMGVMIATILFLLPIPWWLRLIACVFPTILAGTYQIATIEGDKFRSQLFVGFVPLKSQKCNLPGVTYIETKFNSIGWSGEASPFMSPLKNMCNSFFDFMMPALGGAYEIWLITAKGREIMAWQGLDQSHFEENVALLIARSGAELRGRSK